MSDELKYLGPAKVAARIVFACGITALIVMSVYFGILWLVGARAERRTRLRARVVPVQ